MTNGEKIQTILDIDQDCTEVYGKNGMMTFSVTQDWWNAEYKEPITENCIACKYDETEEEDGVHCKKCLEGDSQFVPDDALIESITKSDSGVELSIPHLEPDNCGNYIVQVPTTKNDLRIDCINRNSIKYYPGTGGYLYASKGEIDKLPSLGVDKTFYEQMVEYCNEHFLVLVEKDVWEDAEKALTTKNDLGVDCISRKQAIDAFPDLLPNIGYNKKAIKEILQELPLVTPHPRKGHWIKYGIPRCGEQHYQCTNCENYVNFGQWGEYYKRSFKYCPNCGADMRGEE